MAVDYSKMIISELADHGYQFLKTLGSGQYGVVVLAIRIRDRAKLAIKITKSLDVLQAEIAIFNALTNHPSIATYYGAWTTRHMSGVVMDYIEGRSLLDILMGSPLSEVQACTLFRQLVGAMNHSHYHCHIIHRDLKAENIMIKDNMSRLIIIDWGMGMKWNPGVITFQNCGSPDYAAPELYRNKGYEGPEIDCWAMGVILYAMVTSNFPFPGNTPYEIAYRICKGVYPPPPGSSELVDLISKLLCVDPVRRISLPEVLLHPWFSGSPNMLCESAGHSLGESSLRRSNFCKDLYQSDPVQLHKSDEGKPQRNSKQKATTKSPHRHSKLNSHHKRKHRRSSSIELSTSTVHDLTEKSSSKKPRRSPKKDVLCSPYPVQPSCSSDTEGASSSPKRLSTFLIMRRKHKSTIGSTLLKKE